MHYAGFGLMKLKRTTRLGSIAVPGMATGRRL